MIVGYIVLILAIAVAYYMSNNSPCDLLGHKFENSGNVDICSRCKLIKRKVRK
jgi:hypothetical protein